MLSAACFHKPHIFKNFVMTDEQRHRLTQALTKAFQEAGVVGYVGTFFIEGNPVFTTAAYQPGITGLSDKCEALKWIIEAFLKQDGYSHIWTEKFKQ